MGSLGVVSMGARVFLIGILGAAVIGKLRSRDAAKVSLIQAIPVFSGRTLLVSVVVAESLIVFLLVTTPGLGAVAALVWLLGATAALVGAKRRNAGCGCFGRMKQVTVGTFTRNALLISGAAAVLAAEKHRIPEEVAALEVRFSEWGMGLAVFAMVVFAGALSALVLKVRRRTAPFHQGREAAAGPMPLPSVSLETARVSLGHRLADIPCDGSGRAWRFVAATDAVRETLRVELQRAVVADRAVSVCSLEHDAWPPGLDRGVKVLLLDDETVVRGICYSEDPDEVGRFVGRALKLAQPAQVS